VFEDKVKFTWWRTSWYSDNV